MIQIGISTACFYPRPLEETAELLCTLQAPCAEVFFNTESEYAPSFAAQLASKLQTGNVQCVSAHSYTSAMEGLLLLSEYERRTQDGLDQYARYFAAARMLGAKTFTFHGERKIVADLNASATQRKIENYRRLCDLAAQYGIQIAQENVAWCKSENPAYIKMLMENVPQLRFILDLKQAHRAGRHWSEYLEVAGDRLVNVHINDFDAEHSCMLPGKGCMDYTVFFERLQEIGYQKQALIEVYEKDYTDPMQIGESMRYLQKIAENIG